MDELTKRLSQLPEDLTAAQMVLQTGVAIGLCFVLSLVVVYTYRSTHQGTSYSQAYAQTLVLMCIVVSVIMMIIGSNIARAFSLVGALSIIRFRSAVKDPRDVGFIFFVMAVGMAVGTRFYVIAVVLTFMLCGIMFFLTKFNIGAKPFAETMLRVLVDLNVDYENAFKEPLSVNAQNHALLSIDAVGDNLMEVVYTVTMKPRIGEQEMLESIRGISGVQRVSLMHGLQNINV